MSALAFDLELSDAALRRIDQARDWHPDSKEWRAWHVFLHDPQAIDVFIAEDIAGVLGDVGEEGRDEESGFFIRYWENGPHIRLRLRGIDGDRFQRIGEILRESARSRAADLPPPVGGFGPRMQFDSWHPDPGALPWFEPGTVAEIAYEPELRRYGGRHGLSVHERLFACSSRQVLPVIKATLGGIGRRQGIAMALTATAIRTVCPDDRQIEAFLQIMARNWEGFVPDQKAAMQVVEKTYEGMGKSAKELILNAFAKDPGEIANPVVARWSYTLREYFAELGKLASAGLLVNPATGVPTAGDEESLQALQNMMFSQIHMHNNRLGILPQQEFQLANILFRVITSQ